MKTKQRILADPRVNTLERVFDDSGRPEGYVATLKTGFNWDGCSFIREVTLRKLAESLKEIEDGKPY